MTGVADTIPDTLSGHGEDSLVASTFTSLLCVLLFLLLNPFLALFILAVVSFWLPVPKFVFLVVASLAFTIFFNAREIGIEWYPGVSGDDAPAYIGLYESNYGLSFSDLVARFLAAPNGYEILWHLPWWFMLNQFDASDQTFIFTHYLVVFLTLFVAMRLLSKKYWLALTVVYFFLVPISVDGVAHIWRQQLAWAMFVSGIALVYARGRRSGLWLIYLSPFMHLSLVFFVITYWVFLAIRRVDGFANKRRFVVLMALLMMIAPVVSAIAVRYLDAIGMSRILAYFEADAGSRIRTYLLLSFYAFPMLLAYLKLRNDDMNHLFLVIAFAVFSIVVALPGANGIYDRLLLFALPLMSLYFYRCLLANFQSSWYPPALCFVFAIGAYRLYLPTLEEAGVLYFVANGHGLDPTMGVLRLLSGV